MADKTFRVLHAAKFNAQMTFARDWMDGHATTTANPAKLFAQQLIDAIGYARRLEDELVRLRTPAWRRIYETLVAIADDFRPRG